MTQNTSLVPEISVLLASIHTLSLKVQNYHWNIEGPEFFAIHEFTETLYAELAAQTDDVAERIRMLGEKAPGTFVEYLKLSCVSESKGEISTASVVSQLTQDYATLIVKIKEIIAQAGEDGDDGTADLLSPYISSYEKTVWMLKSFEKKA